MQFWNVSILLIKLNIQSLKVYLVFHFKWSDTLSMHTCVSQCVYSCYEFKYGVSTIIQVFEWRRDGVPNLAGDIALVFAMAMWATSSTRIRRKMFEVFFYTHHLYALYILFYILHVGAAYSCMILPGIYLFLVDRYLRFLQSRRRARLVSARILPCDSVELNFSKSPGIKQQSIIYLNSGLCSETTFPHLTCNFASQGWFIIPQAYCL